MLLITRISIGLIWIQCYRTYVGALVWYPRRVTQALVVPFGYVNVADLSRNARALFNGTGMNHPSLIDYNQTEATLPVPFNLTGKNNLISNERTRVWQYQYYSDTTKAYTQGKEMPSIAVWRVI